MSNFFKNFPLVQYKFGDEKKPALFQNLTAYIEIFNDVVNNGSFYEDYYIKDGERADTISYNLYGTDKYYWTIYLANEDLREKGWPLDTQEIHDLKNQLFGDDNNYVKTLAYNVNPTQAQLDRLAVDPVQRNIWGFQNLNKQRAIEYLEPGIIIAPGIDVGPYRIMSEVKKVNFQTGVVTHEPLRNILSYEILDVGSGYDVQPTLIVEGSGSGAELVAGISNGGITSVTITKTGSGYEDGWTGRGTLNYYATSFYDPISDRTISGMYYHPEIDVNLLPKIKVIRNSESRGVDAVIRPIVSPRWFWMNQGFGGSIGSFAYKLNLTRAEAEALDGNNYNLASYRDEDEYQNSIYFAFAHNIQNLISDSIYEFRDSNNNRVNFNIWDETNVWYSDSANEPLPFETQAFATGNYIYPGTPITNFEALEEINTNLRKIRVLRPNIAAQVDYEFNKILKESQR